MIAYALTIFTGAFLLFGVQPLIGKYILPWFGGANAVWTTCMLFFQLLLLGGYAYAHLTTRRLGPRAQAVVHLVLLLAALAVLPIIPAESWKPSANQNPTFRILGLLTVTLGLPYFVLSATGPLLQHWFSRTNPARSPYRLFALSNAASLVALLSYPLVFETHFTRKAQAGMWSWAMGVFAVCSGFCAVRIWMRSPALTAVEGAASAKAEEIEVPSRELAHATAAQHSRAAEHGSAGAQFLHPEAREIATARPSVAAPRASSLPPPSAWTRLLWLLLPACASVLLLAVTNKMCQDVAVMPFLWVLPLALYLLSFIISFDSPRWYQRVIFVPGLVIGLWAMRWAIAVGVDAPLYELLAIYVVGLFIACMVCHGELYRLKPDPRYLTSYYLFIAAGGALGGIFVALIAPVFFNDYYELQTGMLLCGLLFAALAFRSMPNKSEDRSWKWLASILPLLVLVAMDQALAGALKPAQPVMVTSPLPTETPTSGWLLLYRIVMGVLLAGLAYYGQATRAFEKPGGRFWSALAMAFVPWAVAKKIQNPLSWRRLVAAWGVVGLLTLSIALVAQARRFSNLIAEKTRNFYGVLTVFDAVREDPDRHHLALAHGRVQHGVQMAHPIGATWPTLYYNNMSGAGLAIVALPHSDRRIGLVGLGIGTLGAYSRTNDYFRAYEINPEVVRLAKSRFSYISHCRGKFDTVLGDARLSLEREAPQHFDLLALDAFSGDAIPAHLLTKEAFELYERHLKANGVIAVHVSNHYLDLEPVLANVARAFNYHIAVVDCDPRNPAVIQASPGGQTWYVTFSTWVLLTRDPHFLETPKIRQMSREPHVMPIPLWTDDFTSLYQILRTE